MLKLCELYPDETVFVTTEVFIRAFITRFSKITLEIAQNQVIQGSAGGGESEFGGQMAASNDQFSTAVKRLTLLEKEIFDAHRSSKLRLSNWKRRQNHSVEFNYDLMDNETKTTIRKLKVN